MTAAELARLDELRPAGTSRPAFLRSLLHEPPRDDDVATRGEALAILTSQARDGKVSSAIALERALRNAGVEITRHEIRTATGYLKAVASDGPKQHGPILSLAIVDELHAHRDAELYTAPRTGMLERRDAKIVTISTAGADDLSALGELRR